MVVHVLDGAVDAGVTLECTACIIGAGIAGLIAATRLAEKHPHQKFLLLESGLKHFDSSINALNQIENPAENYLGALFRRRGLGGTSLAWAGKLLPLSRNDTKPRPYLDLPGWPFDVAELDPYQRELEDLMGVDGRSLEEDITAQLDPKSLLLRDNPDFCLRWPKRPTLKNHNLAHVFRKQLQRLGNLEVWLDATVSGFDVDPSSGRIRALKVTNQRLRSVTVKAREYLIAAGTLESTRLLLLADRHGNDLISRESNALGRYFNDHFGFDCATLVPKNYALTNLMLSDRFPHSTLRHLHFELRPAAQEKHRIGSAYFDIGVELPEPSSLAQCKHIAAALKRGRFDFSFGELKIILKDSSSLLRAAQWQYLKKQRYWHPKARPQLKIWVEQLPRWQNRILLSDRVDALGVPVLKLDMEKTDAEEETFRTMIRKIDRYWSASLSHVCDLEWKPGLLNSEIRIVDRALDQAHPAGSTRMGTNRKDSVVDLDLKVHRMPNLRVASASVFPSSGSANPTLTIMQLAMRAADALMRRL